MVCPLVVKLYRDILVTRSHSPMLVSILSEDIEIIKVLMVSVEA